MNAPKLRFSEFDGEWKTSTFDEVFSIIDGDRGKNYPNSNDFIEDGHCLFLNAKNVTKNGFSLLNKMFIDKTKDNSMTKGKLLRNDLVLTTRGTVGNIAYYSRDIPYENIRINSGMLILRSKTNESLYNYIYMKSNSFSKSIKFTTFGSAQPQLTVKDVKKMNISFPDLLKEQKKIATFIMLLDQKIGKQQMKLDKLEDFKKGMLQKIFSKKLLFKDENGEDFGEWNSFLFKNVVSNKSDKVNPEDGSDLNMCIELENIESGSGRIIKDTNYVDQTSMKNKFTRESVLFGKLRPYLKKFWFSDSEGMCSTEIWVLSPRVSNLNKKFLYYFIQTEYFMEYANKSSGSKMPRADWNIISNIEFMIPTIEEQQKISGFFSTLDNKIENENNKIESLKNQKKGFMQQMFI